MRATRVGRIVSVLFVVTVISLAGGGLMLLLSDDSYARPVWGIASIAAALLIALIAAEIARFDRRR